MLKPVIAAALLVVSGTAMGVASAQETNATQPASKAAESIDRASLPFKLMVGDKAPALSIEKWVKGEPVTGFEKGKVYVVEFWATWCGPCIAAMPHLTELQKEYRDQGLTVIGVTSEDPGNSLEAVQKMVAEKGDDKMGYTVAWDKGRETNDAYMVAAYQRGIPTSFLIDREGRVAYIGHPMRLDGPLKEVLEGTHDINAAAEQYARQMAPQAEPARFFYAMVDRDLPTAKKLYAEMKQKDPRNAPRFATAIFNLMLTEGTPEETAEFGSELIEENKNNAQLLNFVAWSIVDPDATVKNRDLDLALKAAERANELTDSSDPAIIDTLATVHHLKGNHDQAIQLQTKAVDLADDPRLKEELQDRLEKFKAAKGE